MGTFLLFFYERKGYLVCIAVVRIRVETLKFMLALVVRLGFDFWLRKLT